MKSCTHCTKASTDPIWPGYQASCRGCKVRALANGMQFFEAIRAERILPPYKAALITTLGEDWKTSHKEVKAEYERIKKLKEGIA